MCWKWGPKNCWRYWGCSESSKQKCPVYKCDQGARCWEYTQNFEPPEFAKPLRNFHKCNECPWYKKLHPENT